MARFVLALLCAAWVCAHASPFVDVPLDGDAIAALGGAWNGPFGYPSALVRGAFTALPLGPVAMRVSLGNAALAFVLAWLVFEACMRLTRHVASDTLRQACAALATLAVSTAPSYVYSASSVGPALFTAVLALYALVLDDSAPLDSFLPPLRSGQASLARRAFLLGLAIAEGPSAFVLVLAAQCVQPARVSGAAPRLRERDGSLLLAFVTGALPLVVGVIRSARHTPLSLSSWAHAPWPTQLQYGERLVAFLRDDLGTFALVAAPLGVVLLLWVDGGSMRRHALRVVLVLAAALLLVPFRAPDGVADGVALTALALAQVLFGALAASLLAQMQRVRLPLAKTSAALVVLLLGSIPVRNIDEVVSAPPALARESRLLFDYFLTGSFTAFPVVLATRIEDEARLRGMEAAGRMRCDAHVVTMTRPEARTAERESAREPALIPIFRDVVISRAPEALSLSELARERAVYLLDPGGIEKNGARQLVPAGLGYEFYPEPRGRADRARGLTTLAKDRARLASLHGAPGLAPELTRRLRARALAMGNADDLEMLSASLEDLRSVEGDDPWLTELPKRMVLGHGHIDMTGLDPR